MLYITLFRFENPSPNVCQIELIWLFTVVSKIVGRKLQKRKSKRIIEREKVGIFGYGFLNICLAFRENCIIGDSKHHTNRD